MSRIKWILPIVIAALAGFSVAQAAPLVVASIKPIHSLVSGVMDGVATPVLLVESGSPHTYSLKPSQAKQLENADAIFWVGHDLEAFLEKPLQTIPRNTVAVELEDAKGLLKLAFRESDFFDEHAHSAHGDEKHDHGQHHDDKEHHDDHGAHHHEEHDPHVWLDPVNAKAMVNLIEKTLVSVDSENAARYKANADRLRIRLNALTDDVRQQVMPIQGRGFIVFHDAYQYFENRFGVYALGSITVSPEFIPGARRIAELKEKVVDSKVTCVFSEPQFEPRIVAVIIEGTNARAGVLDPLGAKLTPGPDMYFELIQAMASSLKSCLLP